MFDPYEILETQRMFSQEHLDVRTITMGIDLHDCASDSSKTACQRIYDKITRQAEHLVSTGEAISREYGIPIINKRISVTPIAAVAAAANDTTDYTSYAIAMDRAAKTVGVNYIGGFSALIQKGMTRGEQNLLKSIPEALNSSERVCASLNLGTTRSGINMDGVRETGLIIKDLAARSADQQGFACAKLVVFANAPDDNPFMAGAFTGPGEGECTLNIGVSGPGVVLAALKQAGDCSVDQLAELIKETAFKVTRAGQLVGSEAARRLGVPLGILDLSLAPTPAVGDSIARILEAMGLETCGAWGTTCALAMLNDAVKKGGIMASSRVGGLSGAFIPVSEDEGMIHAVEVGALSLEKLEAMTCVCSVGIDMVAIPGDTPASTISGIIADELAVGVYNNKTTAVRIIPVPGAVVGDKVSYGGLWGDAPIMQVNPNDCSVFINRGGHIPAPIHSLKS
ncbi:PFL family protein [Oscillospiraceae bacterium HV4-5-C5C]|nr:PFL family protein [Oscillospiraceae bacterium HV4-5-C5C]